ncbi:hypothetical protein U9M48_041899 [Paspalum notatum var. saurae]|uniref:KIB1-4 beta-propeller domain-containing protein n=1 Tax=Paspalum notatum var. saurae TaxID=547442 RepID=A0AAQ3UVR2_PASNO
MASASVTDGVERFYGLVFHLSLETPMVTSGWALFGCVIAMTEDALEQMITLSWRNSTRRGYQPWNPAILGISFTCVLLLHDWAIISFEAQFQRPLTVLVHSITEIQRECSGLREPIVITDFSKEILGLIPDIPTIVSSLIHQRGYLFAWHINIFSFYGKASPPHWYEIVLADSLFVEPWNIVPARMIQLPWDSGVVHGVIRMEGSIFSTSSIHSSRCSFEAINVQWCKFSVLNSLSSKSDSKFDLASALPVLVHDMGTQQVGSQTLYSVSKQALFTDAIDEIGASKWDSCDYTITVPDAQDNPEKRHIARRNGIAAVGGKVYFQLSGYELGVIEFNPDASLAAIEVDMVDLPLSKPLCSTYLVGSCNELFLVDAIFDGENVHKIAELVAFKMDFSEPAWHKVDRISDGRVFLLGGDRIGVSNFGASCMATRENGLCANSIYFLNHLAITENYLHVFSLDKGTEQVQRPFRDMGFDMPVRSPFWILPTNP